MNTVIQEVALDMMRIVEVISTVVILQSPIRHCKYYTGIYRNEDAIHVSSLGPLNLIPRDIIFIWRPVSRNRRD